MHPNGSSPITIRSAADVGSLVRARRRDMNMTQLELANMTRLSRRFISEVEDGKETAQIGKILELLSHLGISLAATS